MEAPVLPALHMQINTAISAQALAKLYRSAGLRRPVDDLPRMARMLAHANLLVSAWQDQELVGVARCFCDYGWACYLSDLAVDKDWQHAGVGRALVECVREEIGPECQLVLLSAPEAMGYYPKIGFRQAENAFVIARAVGI